MSKDEPLLSNCPLETAEPGRNYARVPGYKKKYKKKTRKRREKKRKMNGVEINTRAYVATRLLLRWDYLYAVTLKTKVFGDYNHARLEVSWVTCSFCALTCHWITSLQFLYVDLSSAYILLPAVFLDLIGGYFLLKVAEKVFWYPGLKWNSLPPGISN